MPLVIVLIVQKTGQGHNFIFAILYILYFLMYDPVVDRGEYDTVVWISSEALSLNLISSRQNLLSFWRKKNIMS